MGRVAGQVRVAAHALSDRARARGLATLDDVKAAVLRQQLAWWHGQSFHCAVCDLDFASSGSAAAHTVDMQHPVLRMD